MADGTDVDSRPQPAGHGYLYWMDTSRALLILLGIPYHAAFLVSVHAPWYDVAAMPGPLRWAADFSHVFRMPAFFVIAGFFAAMVIAKSGPGPWLADRARRLLVPFVAATLLLGPPQLMIVAAAYSGGPSWGSALLELAAQPGMWISQTWFLFNLFCYCAVLAIFVRWVGVGTAREVLGGQANSGSVRIRRIRMIALSALAIGCLVVVGGGVLLTQIWGIGDAQLPVDTRSLLLYLPSFIVGVILGVRRELLARASALGIGWCVVIVLAAVGVGWWSRHQGPLIALSLYLLIPLVGTAMAGVVMTVMRRWGNRPTPVGGYLRVAALPVYLFHNLYLLLTAYLLLEVAMPWPVRFCALVLSSLVLSFLTFEVIRRSAVLSYLFDGRRSTSRKAVS